MYDIYSSSKIRLAFLLALVIDIEIAKTKTSFLENLDKSLSSSFFDFNYNI